MKRILFVCLGNICRSPGAEAIMKKYIALKHSENSFFIDSAGLYAGHSGSLPDERMQWHAGKRGYTLDSRARAFYPSADFADFDMIVGMDRQNLMQLKKMAVTDEEKGKIYGMMSFSTKYSAYSEVPDPYYEGPEGFEIVLDLLEDAVKGLYNYCMNH